MNGLGEGQETVGGENKALEVVAVTQSLRDTLQLVTRRHEMFETRQLPNCGRYSFKIEADCLEERGRERGREGGEEMSVAQTCTCI